MKTSSSAEATKAKYVVKTMSSSGFSTYRDIYRDLGDCPYVRVACDNIPSRSSFVYHYFSDDLLSLARQDLPLSLVKRIIKDSLRGLAALHDRRIVHTGMSS